MIQVTYRTIAKSICAHTPVGDDEFIELVNSTLKALDHMSETGKLSVKVAYIFSRLSRQALFPASHASSPSMSLPVS